MSEARPRMLLVQHPRFAGFEEELGGLGAKQSVSPAHAARPLSCVLSRANSFGY